MAQLFRKLKRAVFNYDPSFCDMYEDARARTAAEEYLTHIRTHLHRRFGQQSLTILDAGCQAGRLLIPLAQDGHRMIGIDTSGFALRRTRQHARRLGLRVRLHRGSIAALRQWVAPASLDAVVCTEVLYLCENHRELLRLMAQSVKPGGLLCMSHRPRLYYVATAIRKHRVEHLASLMTQTEGPSSEGEYHNWQTPELLGRMYAEHGLNMLDCLPVDHVAQPLDVNGTMPADARELLQAVAIAPATFRIPSYLLVIAQRPSA